MRSICLLLTVVVVTQVVGPTAAWADPAYRVAAPGLYDAEHTRDDGFRFTFLSALNDAGHVAGLSWRYDSEGEDLGDSAWFYDGTTTTKIGLTGSEHTRDDGFKELPFGERILLSQSGHVASSAVRYEGGSEPLGQSSWLFDGTTTFEIGLTGADHTRHNGSKFTEVFQLNNAGMAIGESARLGTNGGGRSAWLYDGTSTIDIGFTGEGYTHDDGQKTSNVLYLNDAGQAIGESWRYGGGTAMGQSAWFYDGATTVNIGLTGDEHTRSDGFQHGQVRELSQTGYVTGSSRRYEGSVGRGVTAWLYDGATTTRLGITDAEHTDSDGNQTSWPYELNDAGHVTGVSYRYNGGSEYLGVSAWHFDGTETVEIGLSGSEFTRDDGYQSVTPVEINAVGQVRGLTRRYGGAATEQGLSAWFYDGTTTVEVGLSGPGFVRDDGYRFSAARGLNNDGQMMGIAERFDGSESRGQAAWWSDGEETVEIGLTDGVHTHENGFSFADVRYGVHNEFPYVTGSSARYGEGSSTTQYDVGSLGSTAWVYVPELDETFAFDLFTRSDRYAFSDIRHVSPDGLVLGSYRFYDEDQSLRVGAFSFTVEDGWRDLGMLIDGGLDANGWEALGVALRANSKSQIAGNGQRASQPMGPMIFLLTPIPEPSTALLACIAVVGLLARRRRIG